MSNSNLKTALVIFCDDFRVDDNPALYHACKNYDNIIPIFIYSENYLGRKLGGAAKVFLHHTLQSFNTLLQNKYGISLVIKQGDVLEQLTQICKEQHFDAIFMAKSYTQAQINTEKQILKQFKDISVNFTEGKILFNPESIKTNDGNFFKIFTPFSKKCLTSLDVLRQMVPQPDKIISTHNLQSLSVKDLNLLPKNQGNWRDKMMSFHELDYDKINQNFSDFILNKLPSYEKNRNLLSGVSNSAISHYLRFGILSVRLCFEEAFLKTGGYNQFILELLWRDFAYHVGFFNQNIATEEIKTEYSNFKWDNKQNYLQSWQKCNTGYDIVDAAMSELYTTGLMHGRARMIVASFLIKDLFCDWKLGEQWFWDTLVDADVMVNPFSWQWVFGSGFDAAPYFRIFNPDSQKERFDPDSSYIKKWLPKNYKAEPFVLHDLQRSDAMQRYKAIKGEKIEDELLI